MGIENLLGKLTPSGQVIDNLALDSVARGERRPEYKANGVETVTGKTAEITACDVAGALVGLDEKIYYFALAKYTDDKKSANKFWGLLYEHTFTLWPEINGNQARVLSLLAIEGCIWYKHCKRCLGLRMEKNNHVRRHVCKRCMGSGRERVKGTKAASMLEVSESGYRKKWRDRIGQLETLLDNYEHVVKVHLARAFSTSDKFPWS